MATSLRSSTFPAPNRLSRFFGLAGRRPRGDRRQAARNRVFFSLEAMEERALMSNIPVLATVSAPATTPTVVQLAPMQNTVVNGSFPQWQYWNQEVEANLTAGEIYAVSEDVQATNQAGQFSSNTPSGLFVAEPDGTWAGYHDTFSAPTTDPLTGNSTNDNSVVFRAPVTGLYTFGVGHIAYGSTSDSYTLTIRPIALDNSTLVPDQNAADAAKLSFQGGGLYAFLDPTDTVLTLDGPTGRGFQLTGQFQETVTPVSGSSLTTATITSTGSSITLDSGLGPITLPLPSGTNFTVTTLANGYNGLFGEVSTAGVQFPAESIINDILNPVSSQVGLNLNSLGLSTELPGVEFGIALGDNPAVMANNAPVNPAVPYLYLNVNTGFTASFGKIEAGALAKGASVAIDPADPSIFVDIKGLPGLSNLNFGLSEHGYIAFTPEQTPNDWGNQALYGDVSYGGTLNIAELTENAVPISLSGEAVINFNTTAGPWTSGLAQKVQDLFNGDATLSELETEAYGLNGTMGLALGVAGGGDLSVPLDAATVIIDGPAQSLYFRGGTINPLAGTQVAFLDTNANGAALGFTADGYLNFGNGQFDATLYGNFTIDQIGLSGTLNVSNSGITANASLDLGFLYGSVSGSIYWYGGYELGGSVYVSIGADVGTPDSANVSGGLDGVLNIALYQNGYADIWGNAEVYGSVSVAGNNIGSIDQIAYFNVSTNVGFDPSSFLNEAASAIDSAVESLYNSWSQSVQNGWNWFWSGSWL
ncbi:MAG: hypothetical protein ACP5XB_04980 [Isosphaeraceae bacterium]